MEIANSKIIKFPNDEANFEGKKFKKEIKPVILTFTDSSHAWKLQIIPNFPMPAAKQLYTNSAVDQLLKFHNQKCSFPCFLHYILPCLLWQIYLFTKHSLQHTIHITVGWVEYP